ncbi:MAG: hypothetical protein ACOYVF_04885 [Candidatus Zixiibacteriota bacterium]
MVSVDEINKRYKQALLIGMLMLVGIPLIFVLVATFAQLERVEVPESYRFMFYMLALVAFVEPFIYQIIRKVQIGNYRKSTGTKMTAGQFVLNHEITRFAFVNSIFVLGVVTYLVGGEGVHMLYFYIYGLIWAFIYWPRFDKIKTLMESLEVS